MNIKFHDRRAIRLGNIKLGEIAVGVGMRNAERVFIKTYVPADDQGRNKEQIIELTDLYNQYLDKLDLEQPVRLLEKGESVEFMK